MPDVSDTLQPHHGRTYLKKKLNICYRHFFLIYENDGSKGIISDNVYQYIL